MQNPDSYCVVLTRSQFLDVYEHALTLSVDQALAESCPARNIVAILRAAVSADPKALDLRYKPSGAPLSLGEVL